MKPTFQKGDYLSLKPCEIENLNTGDIVAFRNISKIKGNEIIVHRIIRVDGKNLFTQGDNNKRIDIIPITPVNLIGKVTDYERNGKCHRVIGGWRGLIRARTVNFFRKLFYGFFTKVQWLLPTKLFRNILNKFPKSRIQKIKFSTKEGPIIKWVFRNRTIAHWLPEKKLQKTSFLSRFLINSEDRS